MKPTTPTASHHSTPTSSAVAAPTSVHFDATTVVVSILVPFIIALFAAIFAVRYAARHAGQRRALRVQVTPELEDDLFRELAALYCSRVPDYERVPPSHFKAFFRREYSATSERDFRRRTKSATTPVHVLLLARGSAGISGFLKAIYIPDIRCLYIAYLVTARGGEQDEWIATRVLTSFLLAMCRDSDIESIIYEICAEHGTHPKAKARLFNHYASALGLKFHRIDAKYQQPEICAFEEGDCKRINANLFIAHVGVNNDARATTMSSHEYKRLVSSIYDNIYFLSYAIAEPSLSARYQGFLQQVKQDLFAQIGQKPVDLR